MKINAIRVAEFGRFREPVALEGLSGGLDLLIGPNEAGKSTLVRALHMAFFEKHRSNKADLAELRPYAGGAPLVEVEFVLGTERWRLRKRFLSERLAELASLSTGTVARGSDAEAELERLLDLAGTGGRFPLLWLGQGEALAPMEPNEDGEAALRMAIAREVASSTGGSHARDIRRSVQAALGELVTATRGQRRGRFLAAFQAAEAATADLVKARAAHADVEELLERLARLDGELSTVRDAKAQAAITDRLAVAEERRRRAFQDCAARDTARIEAMSARTAHAAAAAALRAMTEAQAELDRLTSEEREDAAESDAARTALAAAQAKCDEASLSWQRARAAVDSIRTAIRAVEAAERRRSLEARAEGARTATERVRSISDALAGAPLDGAVVREARRLEAAAAEARLRLEAAASTVSVTYESGAEGKIRLGERRIGHGDRLLAIEPIALSIEGVGTIMIVPGASADRGRLERELATSSAALGEILAATGSHDLAELEAHHEVARRLASDLAEARAALRALAPEGLSRLEEALADATAASPHDGPEAQANAATPDEMRKQLVLLEATARSAEVHRQETEVVREDLRQKLAVLSSRRAQRELRVIEVNGRLPPEEVRSDHLASLRSAADASSRALDDALRIASAWEARAPDAESIQRLDDDVAVARQEFQRAEQKAASLAEERARIEGALEAARREDIATRVAVLEAGEQRARDALADIEEEVAALRLLDAELGAEEDRLTNQYLAPVLARLAPYLDLVFPGATIALDGRYGVDGLLRNRRSEAIGRLSAGTREQIAVLVRLAFARLLAEQGLEVPLLLDDALVYSDDHRIAAMHRALEAAATSHQVIVLTCREASFAGLRGERVKLTPWISPTG